MIRLIDAGSLLELYNGCEGLHVPIEVVIQNIKDMPIVAEPVKHGHWTDEHKCSVCGGEAFSELINICPQYEYDSDGLIVFSGDYEYNFEYYKTNFCPHCGAKMDEEEQSYEL